MQCCPAARLLMRVAVPLTLTCSTGYGESDGDLSEVFGSGRAIETVKRASSVKAFRLRPDTYHKTLSGFETTTGPVDVPAISRSWLRNVLLDRSAYAWDSSKACQPVYGVRLQFQHERDVVDVLLCFQCDVLTVYHNGTAVGGEDFDNIRFPLVSIVTRLFPDDAEIQSLESPLVKAARIFGRCVGVGFLAFFGMRLRRRRRPA